ncbi:MAG: hypothetical protein M1833_000207 [Piccolia ochrophora]|nr:MAG: hypothetical protein M1833_000207 [Piccolia ochrophora]
MAPNIALTTKPSTGSPYQLNHAQTERASTALLKHIKSEQKRKDAESSRHSLLARASSDDDEKDDSVEEDDDVPIWLVLTTKKHITDKKKLKPSRISIPHPLFASPTTSICLITTDPQRPYKDLVADPSFPTDLRPRITRVIAASKIRTKYKTYESRRQLLSQHDIFLADDRVVTLLPNLLGKTFYKISSKRPIPVDLSGGTKARKAAATAADGEKSRAKPVELANAITRALSSALVYLSPSTCTSIRIGRASWPAEKVVENIEAVVPGLVQTFVPKQWRGVRGLHIKGPNTTALPLWLADELWVDEADILDKPVTAAADGKKRKAEEQQAPREEAKGKKKRSGLEPIDTDKEGESEVRLTAELSKAEARKLSQNADENRKRQKAEAVAKVEGDEAQEGVP